MLFIYFRLRYQAFPELNYVRMIGLLSLFIYELVPVAYTLQEFLLIFDDKVPSFFTKGFVVENLGKKCRDANKNI